MNKIKYLLKWQVLVSGDLFDLTGLGFSSNKKEIVRTVAPTLSISVNGEAIDVPPTPVRSTNENGIVSYDLYEANYNLPSGITGIPTVTVFASDPDVKVAVTQAESNTGTAIARFDYNGVIKTYRVVFAPDRIGK